MASHPDPPAAAAPVRVVELAAPPAAGKSTVLQSLLGPEGAPTAAVHLHHRRHAAGYRRRRRMVLLWRFLPMWLEALRILTPAVGLRAAGTRTAKYLTHLWRRHEQAHLTPAVALIEDEGFISWAATDIIAAPRFADWLRRHGERLYPGELGGRPAEYAVVALECSEWVRVQRILRRRLDRGSPARAARKTRTNGLRSRARGAERIARAIVLELPAVQAVAPGDLAAVTAGTVPLPPRS